MEAATRSLPKDDALRACAIACVGKARMRLRLGGGNNETVRLAVATKLGGVCSCESKLGFRSWLGCRCGRTSV
ncbi:DUF6415 family natural product biosynthesis protein [Streptomyces sp. NRRL S-813]|uniref:DUF6415 family natural product biosynthesis protein n=1 Tax=Streptomyces sp. NRRL S-813 TaxID=1463919 RepID=UPI001F2BDDE3|nr:DUF6415 family natural product biosynthesis protein [Streptomyces sp. NRRL S-813]